MGYEASMETSTEDATPPKPNIIGIRHFQAFLMFLGLLFGYFLRVNISTAIVSMTTVSEDEEYYDWSTSQKSLILSSFFWGYVLAQIPSGLLAKRFGAKLVLGIATVLGSILTILHPVVTSAGGFEGLVILRVFVGLLQGVVYPSVHTLLAKWAPRTERSFLGTAVYSGAQLGTCIILATSGPIYNSGMGWAGIFYISGAVTLIWAIVFLIFGADSPADERFISDDEKHYIESLTGSGQGTKNMAVPWKSIFTSLPFYGLIAAHSGFTWGFYTLLTEIPSYMSNILDLDMKANAMLSALPYFVMWLLCFVFSPLSDFLINHKYISTEVARKVFNTVGQWIPMICLILLGTVANDNVTTTTTLLTIAVGFNAASFCGYLVNHMDLSPNFAGPLMGITNGVANVMSLFTPLVVGAVVEDEENQEEWCIVFFIAAGVYFLCNLLFLIFGRATIQSWNEPTMLSSTTSLHRDASKDTKHLS